MCRCKSPDPKRSWRESQSPELPVAKGEHEGQGGRCRIMARFYVSSTFQDLENYRKEVYRTLRRLGHDAIAMEDYVASDVRPVSKCIADVSSCDCYIGIVAWRRGHIPDSDNPHHSSITELEYEQATSGKKPRLIFLLSPAALWPEQFRCEESDASVRDASLPFRDRLQANHVVSTFETVLDLALLVAIAIRKWEVESGYRKPALALIDQRFPPELKIRSYVPGDHLALSYRVPFSQRVFLIVFMALWWGGLAFVLVWSAYNRSLVVFMFVAAFVSIGIFLSSFGSVIRFDFKRGEIILGTPASRQWMKVFALAISLKHRRTASGWRTTLNYDLFRKRGLELGRTATYPSLEESRARFRPFAEALSFELGSHSIVEVIEGQPGP